MSKLLTNRGYRAKAVNSGDAAMRRISIIDGPNFKQHDGSKMGYRANIVFGNSDGVDFSYQLHLGVIKKDILHPVYLF